MFPSITFRRAYDVLKEHKPRGADLEYLRLLRLAATTLESEVERALAERLSAGKLPDYAAIKAAVAPEVLRCPEIELTAPDLEEYDALLADQAVCS